MGDLRRGSRILVVDDDNALREAIGRRLRRSHHVVVTAENAQIALAHCELGRPPFDVVVTDVHMPGLSGLDLATALIERRPMQRVIIITSDPDEALKRAALSRGPVSFLLKPFELFELEAAIEQALAMPRFMTPPPNTTANTSLEVVGTAPAEWLLWIDDRSNAGRGHADRVARMARVAAMSLLTPMAAFELAELEVAAWSHELGLLAGPSASPVEMAWRGAEILQDCGASDDVCRLVRLMHERWDGSGGPEGLVGDAIPLGAQILSAVDAIDHYSAAWLQTGMRPELAAHRAVSLVVAQQGSCFSPMIAVAVNGNRDALRTLCGVERRTRSHDVDGKPGREISINSSLEAIA
jgi:two-component system response regulator RpfG